MKSAKKSSAKRAVVPKKSAKLNEKDELAALRLENKNLRATVNHTWALLNAVNPESDSAEMFAAIDAACHEMITNHPKEFHYEESKAKDDGAGNKLIKVASSKTRRAIAEELNVPVGKLSGVDFNQFLPAWRKVFTRETGATIDPAKVTDEEYLSQVGLDLSFAMLFAAKTPTTPRKEAQRYLSALLKLKAGIPQARRKAADEVERAIELKSQGKRWTDIYFKLRPNLMQEIPDRGKRAEWRNTLRRRATALTHARKKRSEKRGIKKKG
jgi:hypothetical protein